MLDRLPLEILRMIVGMAGPFTMLEYGCLPLPMTAEMASLMWIDCFIENHIHLVPRMPAIPLDSELLFVHKGRMWLALGAGVNINGSTAMSILDPSNYNADINQRLINLCISCPSALGRLMAFAKSKFPNWRNAPAQANWVATAAAGVGDEPLFREASMFRGAGAGDSPFVAACMGGRTALAIQIMNSKYGYITMRGIVAANRLDVLAASDVPISRLPWGFEDYDYAARLGRREILASILPDIHIHGHNSVFAILAAAANADLFLDLFPITNKKSQAIDQIVQAIRARHEGAVRKLHIGMPREVWPLMFVHEAIKADSIEIARLLLLERGMRLENPLLVAAPWASGRMLEFLHSECGGTYNHHVAFQAADFGNLAALKWIHERLGATLGRMAFDKVVASGKLDAVIWMHETTRLPLTLKNLNKAAISGRLAVVSWIIENKHCEPTTDTLIKAATYGHSDVVLYLAKMGLRFPHRAYVLAAQRCNVEVIKYLHEHGPRAVSWSVMQGQATRHGNTPVSNWLRNRQRDAER